MRELTFDAWDTAFVPIANPRHPDGTSYWFETYGDDLAQVLAAPPTHVWTMVDGDDDTQWILHGFHRVNRVLYAITEQPGDEAEDYVIALDDTEPPQETDRMTWIENMDWALLRRQKRELEELQVGLRLCGDRHSVETLDGVLNMLDAMQDWAADVLHIPGVFSTDEAEPGDRP